MSKVIKNIREMRDIVETFDGETYYVDSSFTTDHGFETMSFECDRNGHVTNWGDRYCRIYETEEEMMNGHRRACEHLEFCHLETELFNIKQEIEGLIWDIRRASQKLIDDESKGEVVS